MRLGVTRTVAFATRDISIPGFGAIVNAAEEALRSRGYTLLLAMTDERKEQELHLLRIFQQRRVDAVIMTISNEGDTELSRHIRSAGMPVVLLDREHPLQLDAVTLDHRRGIRAATEYLHGLGHTRIALLTGKPSVRPAAERIAGFKEASARLGKLASHAIIRTGGFDADFGFRPRFYAFPLSICNHLSRKMSRKIERILGAFSLFLPLIFFNSTVLSTVPFSSQRKVL